ncbi:hypothetical protein [Hymenobacter oligotrophus]|nr:hypothetical protein [Hymenobacter oligotrophus]
MQHATVELGAAHPQAFAAEVRQLPAAEQRSLFRFLADVEGHDVYKPYPLLMKRLLATGAPDLAALLQQAKERRIRRVRKPLH